MRIQSDEEYVDTDFSGSNFSDVNMRGSRFIRCRFNGVDLTELQSQSTTFTTCDFTGAHLNASHHTRSAFLNCQFRLASLFGTTFEECKMTGSSFVESNMDAITIIGGDWSYTHLRFHRFKGLCLRKVKFTESDLYECNLEKCDLREADLTKAVLAKAKLAHADLRGAKIDGIDLKSFDLKDVKIDLAQAVEVARAYGAKVE